MNWKRICRALLCLALVCCILVNASPIKVHATGVEIAYVAVGAVAVVSGILIGLGVLPGVDRTSFNNTVQSCVSSLESQGLVVNGMTNLLTVQNGNKLSYSVLQDLVDAVRSWLFSSKTLTSVSVSSMGIAATTAFESAAGYAFSASLDTLRSDNPGNLLSLFKSMGVYENTLILSFSESHLYGLYFDPKGILCSAAFFNPLGVANASLFGLHAISDLHFDFDKDVKQVTLRTASYTSTTNFPYPVFYDANYLRSYPGFSTMNAHCFDWTSNPVQHTATAGRYFTKFAFYSKSSSDTVLDVSAPVYRGFVDYLDGGYRIGDFTWDSTSISSVATSVDVSLGAVAAEDEEFSQAYSTWSAGSITIPGSVAGSDEEEEAVALPFPGFGSLDDILGLSQEDVWSGTQAGTDVETGTQVGTGTLAGTDSKTFISSLADAIVTPIVNAIRAIFVPSEDYLTSKVEALAARFGFAASVVQTIQALKTGLAGVTTEPPVIYLDLGASRGSYYLGGTVPFLDLRWYSEYKPTVDTIISAFLWICFVWRVFIKLPGIISGMPGDFVAGAAQDMGISNHLPSRSADFERQRVEIRQSLWKGRQ